MKKFSIILLLLPYVLLSQKVTLDTNNILIGDQIQLNISVEIEKDEEYTWPMFTDSIFKKLEIINKGAVIETQKDSNIIISQTLNITSFDSGSYYIPPFIFNENKKTNGLILNVFTINITDSNNRAYDITSNKIGTNEDFSKEELAEIRSNRLRTILIIIAILLSLFLIYFLIKKYKKDGTILRQKVVIHPHVTALNKLNSLKKEKLWQKGEIKEYYSRISTIIREYTEIRFEFNALELPTSDIMKKLKNSSNIETNKLEFILKKADNIKYAKGLSIEEENMLVIRQAMEFVKETKIEKNESSE